MSSTPARIPSAWRLPLACATTTVVFLTLDALWLTNTASALYRPALGHLMADSVDWKAALLFYAIYIAGLTVFALSPALAAGRPFAALGRGAMLGLLAYATYDLTNQATLRGWPWRVTLIDLAWGACVSSLSCWAGAALSAATCRPASPGSGR
ncbi:DUF2177 family protein [Pelomonas sp. CA6]|uniref:DUF2177 family protein n=1 Tax=Pelomonas sp. CA6 TaxID=2907999 RepID=UPI001F4BF508|nr:DUF2177 family protein [Pelomonas sp. CA6]MCH7344022.1 DUF2177 family protein [Pelomonas sp. CA6]